MPTKSHKTTSRVRRKGVAAAIPKARHWNENASGDYAADCMRGEALAETFVQDLRTGRGTHRLGWIARDMIERGHFSGIEVGFFYKVAVLLRSNPPLQGGKGYDAANMAHEA